MKDGNELGVARIDYAAAKCLHACASSEKSRPVLQHVRLADGRGEATNGVVLVRRPLGDFAGERFLHRDVLALVKSGGTLEVNTVTGAVTLTDKAGMVATLPDAPTSPNDSAFPQTDHVIPKYDGTEGVRFALASNVLRMLADVGARDGGHNGRVTLQVVDPNRGFLWEAGDASGVVMPLKVVAR